jgi:hypothetical protein
MVALSATPRVGQQRRLTLRSSRLAPAWHLAREALLLIIRLAGQAPSRRSRLSSNVRPHIASMLRRPRKPPERSTLTKFERLSLYSGLGIALASAILTPAITYFILDPAAKDYEQRGRLVQVDGFGGIQSISGNEDGAVAKIDSSNVLRNTGQRPLKGLELYMSPPPLNLDAEPVIAGRVLERTKSDAKLAIYAVSGALGAGDEIDIRLIADHNTWLAVRTEHGDTVELRYPTRWYNVTPSSAAQTITSR